MLMNTYNRFQLEFIEGKGSYLFDTEGREYLDFVSGIAVNSLGHCHPTLVSTIQAQSTKLWHTSNLYHINEQKTLAEKLIDLSKMSSVFFSNSGTESMEGALKAAKKYGKLKRGIQEGQFISMENSFHGRSMGALSVTGRSKYRESFTPLVAGVTFGEFNNFEDICSKVNESTVGIVLELVQGEGGIHPATIEFVQQIRTLCDDKDIVMIVDEVQTGIGRTGTMFCYEQYGILPDVVTLAKGLGGGVPIGAILMNNKMKDVLQPGDHASTFGGNPLATAVALSVLEVFEEENILENVSRISELVWSTVESWKQKFTGVKELRGKGLLIGIQIQYPIAEVIQKCIEKQLLVLSAGEGVLRILPPLTVSFEEMVKGLEIIESVFSEFESK